MADNNVNLGDTFFLDTPKGFHLFVAIVPLTITKYLFVNTTKQLPNSDLSCIIKPGMGCPPFITQDSVIYYRKPREIESATIFKLIASGECTSKGKFSPNILYKIQVGATISDEIPIGYQNIVIDYLNLTS
ncbi:MULTISPECIES: hypothetical protein [Nostocales]|uniref:Uncharacterized protein n=1 Tax=Dolichospermum flos-aquae UHCC 0037 TaxID=2590026 RepID=A0ACC7S7H1_DOLFA|nr:MULTISPECIES: hypothetical protein [Nostocales]MBO1065749.1 hypothetical protein [Anabaena sp. 54]MTJ44508.1 hypothetical protein [Dolichospermum flos-aquae UHCC 0037]